MTKNLYRIEPEQAVLGGLLLDNDAIYRIGELRTEHFGLDDHRTIFNTVCQLLSDGKPADAVTVYESLSNAGNADKVGGLPYLNALAQNTPSAANIVRYAEIVRDSALRRALIAETIKLAESARNPKGRTAAEILDYAQTTISQLAEKQVKREPIRASAVLRSHLKVLDGHEPIGIPTGFSQIDETLSGGPKRGNLFIVAGRPAMGKTALALNMATNCALNYGVGILSQEMSLPELIERCIASLGQIDLGKIISRTMEKSDWDRFTPTSIEIEKLNLHLDDQPALTLLDVRMKAMALKRRHSLDVLIVDYLQLMAGSDPRANRNTQIEEITRGLKALAKELDIVVIALSQLNRTSVTGRPRLADLRDSGAIEQDADIVMFVHRDEANDPNTHMRGFADVLIAKNRQGAIKDVLLRYDGPHTRFSDYSGVRPKPPPKTSMHKSNLAEKL